MAAGRDQVGAEHVAGDVNKLALDWVDALWFLLIGYGVVFAMKALHVQTIYVNGGLLAGLGLALPWARRRWLGTPTRQVKQGASALGVLATMCIVFGLLIGGGMGALLAFSPPKHYDAPPSDAFEAESRARAAAGYPHWQLTVAGIGGAGIALLLVGGLLDRARTSRA